MTVKKEYYERGIEKKLVQYKVEVNTLYAYVRKQGNIEKEKRKTFLGSEELFNEKKIGKLYSKATKLMQNKEESISQIDFFAVDNIGKFYLLTQIKEDGYMSQKEFVEELMKGYEIPKFANVDISEKSWIESVLHHIDRRYNVEFEALCKKTNEGKKKKISRIPKKRKEKEANER